MNFKNQKNILTLVFIFVGTFVYSDKIERNLESSDPTADSSYRNLIFQQFVDV